MYKGILTFIMGLCLMLSSCGTFPCPAETLTYRETHADEWDTAYGWGNHASAGYLTTETDPVYSGSSWYTTTNNAANWNSAYGWGDHANAGYVPHSGNGAAVDLGAYNLTVDTNTLFIDATNHYVGVGTAAPQRQFHQYYNGGGSGAMGKFLVESTSGSYGQFQIVNPTAGEVTLVFGADCTVNADGTITANSSSSNIFAFGLGSYSAPTTYFTIGSNGLGTYGFAMNGATGNVMIGSGMTDDSVNKLQVAGNAVFAADTNIAGHVMTLSRPDPTTYTSIYQGYVFNSNSIDQWFFGQREYNVDNNENFYIFSWGYGDLIQFGRTSGNIMMGNGMVDDGVNKLQVEGSVQMHKLRVDFPNATGGCVEMNNINAGGVVAFDFMTEGALRSNMAYIGAVEAGEGNEHFVMNYNPGNIPIDVGGSKVYLGYSNTSPATDNELTKVQVNGGMALDNESGEPGILINGGSGFFGGTSSFTSTVDISNNGENNNALAVHGEVLFGSGTFTDPRPGEAWDLKMGGSGTGAIATLGNISTQGDYLINGATIGVSHWTNDSGYELTSNKNQPNGYAGLDADGNLVGVFIPRYDTTANINGMVLEAGELATTSDTFSVRVGDGATSGGINIFASPTFGNITLTSGGDLRPSVDSTTAVNFANAAGTDFITIDTTNQKLITTARTKAAADGTERVTNSTFASDLSGWTYTTGDWTYRTGGGAQHTAGTTTTLTQTIDISSALPSSYYYLQISMTGRTAGSVGIKVGSMVIYNEYGSSEITASFSTGTYRQSGTKTLTITPTSDFDGAITLISVKQITPITGQIYLESMSLAYGTNGLFLGNGGLAYVDGAMSADNSCFSAGISSMRNLVRGYQNTAVGNGAMQNTYCSSVSSAFGYNALNASIGYGNVGVGSDAGAAIKGTYNSAIGTKALGQVGTASSYNTAVGGYAGYYYGTGTSAITSVSNSIFLGSKSRGSSASSDTNTIVIGYNTVGKGSNTAVLGNSDITDFYSYGNHLLEDDHYIGIISDTDLIQLKSAEVVVSGTVDATSYKAGGTAAITDGEYTTGASITPGGNVGKITVKGGIITAIQAAS